MPYSEASRVDEATKRITTTGSVQSNVRAAAKTFGENVDTYMTTYGLGKKDKQQFRDLLVDMLRFLDLAMNK